MWHFHLFRPFESLQPLENGEQIFSTWLNAGWVDVTPANHLIGIEHEERVCAGSLLGMINTIGSRNGPLWLKIREQWEPQLSQLGKSQVRPHSINRDPEQFRLQARKFWQQLIIEIQLVVGKGTPICVVQRQDDSP